MKIKNWIQFNESKSEKIVYEMTGSPRDAMQMLPPKQRTKTIFAKELSDHGYVQGRLNKDCDLLITNSMDTETNKMKKAAEYGCDITTYDALINKYNMFSDINENASHDEVGEILLTYDGQSPTTWFYIQDAILDGLLEEKLQMDDAICEEFAQYYADMTGEIDQDDVDYFTMEELATMIEQDFDKTLDILFDYLIEVEYLDKKPSVEISGNDEQEEEWEFSYFPE